MKKGLFTTVLLFMITLCFSSCQKTETFKVLQFNIWQEGTVVENGFYQDRYHPSMDSGSQNITAPPVPFIHD